MSDHFIIKNPPLPTLRRWKILNQRFGSGSTLRMLQYEKLAEEKLHGKVLDLGGGKNAKYLDLLPPDIEYLSANIDPNIDPTYIVKPGEKLPIEYDSIDCCICMNTLEHVYDPKFSLREIFRVLKPGGKVVISIPWMFRIHGHPDDYSRRTPSWWRIALAEIGYCEAELTPLIWGRYSVAAMMSGTKGIRKHFAHIRDVMYASILFSNARYDGERGQRICAIASGHYIVAQKHNK